MERRVVITGVGMVSPLGIGNQETWDGLIQGRCGIGPITRFDAADYPCRIAGEVKGFNPEDWVPKKDVKKMDLFIHYAMAASEIAMRDAAFQVAPSEADRVGVFIGSGIGGLPSIERQHAILLREGPRRVSPFFIVGLIVNMASGQVSIRYGAKGPNQAACTACATGTHAIGDAFEIIKRGDADVMIAGGCESVIAPLSLGGFSAMRALSTRNDDPEAASRPFDAGRDGFVISEGAGVVILEELGHAVRRGARVYAEVAGYGTSGDAFHVSAPSEDGDGPVRVMQRAIQDAGIDPSAIDYINAHGTSTELNDFIETSSVKQVFKDHAYRIPMSSIKSMLGHMIAAAGVVELIASILTIREGIIPPTINYETPDDACDLDYVPNNARETRVKNVLSNSFGFGGQNIALVVKKFEG